MKSRNRTTCPIIPETAFVVTSSIAVETELESKNYGVDNQLSKTTSNKDLQIEESNTAPTASTLRDNLFRDFTEITSKDNTFRR